MLHFDKHLKFISTSTVHQNTIFRSRYQELITKLCRLNTKIVKLKVITMCNTAINVSLLFMDYSGKTILEFIHSSCGIDLLRGEKKEVLNYFLENTWTYCILTEI